MLHTPIVRVMGMCMLALLATSAVAHADREEIHYLGKVNVNEAPAEELERVPGLTKADIDRIVQARQKAPITNVRLLKLPARAQKYLRTVGASDFARIKKLPLQALEGVLEQSAIVDNDLSS